MHCYTASRASHCSCIQSFSPLPALLARPSFRRCSESVISYHTWPREHKERPKLRAVAALLQRDTSAIVTLKSSGIDRPAKVRGATARDAALGSCLRHERRSLVSVHHRFLFATSITPALPRCSWRASAMLRTLRATRAASCSS